MKSTAAILLLCLCSILAAGSGIPVLTAGKEKTPAATATFWNGADDNVWSDGQPYTDGVRGVMCLVRTDTNQQFILNIVKSTRRLWYYFPPASRLETLCSEPQGPISTGLAVDGFVNVHGIGAIQVGEVRAVRANFGAGSVGWFNFLDNHGTPPSNPWGCSANVAVYRESQTVWHISTSVQRLLGEGAIQQAYDATGTLVTPGDTAQLDESPSRKLLGNYRMPVGFTVYCPTCPAPAPCASRPCPIPQ